MEWVEVDQPLACSPPSPVVHWAWLGGKIYIVLGRCPHTDHPHHFKLNKIFVEDWRWSWIQFSHRLYIKKHYPPPPPPNRGQAWGLLCAIDIFLNSTCWVPSWYFSTTYFCWGKHYLVWGFRLFIVSARISSTWSHTVVCMKSYMLLHVSDFVLQVVKVVQSLVNPHNGCHVILYRSFLAQHDVQCIGYKIPNLIHDDDWGGCSCLHVEQFYTMHPLYYISWLCKVRPFYTLPFFSSSF